MYGTKLKYNGTKSNCIEHTVILITNCIYMWSTFTSNNGGLRNFRKQLIDQIVDKCSTSEYKILQMTILL